MTVNIVRAEMGQHVGTALAHIVADELEADWSKVRIVEVDTDPKWGEMITGGSWSVWQSFPVLSRAGAAVRLLDGAGRNAGSPPNAVGGAHRQAAALARVAQKAARNATCPRGSPA